MQGHTVDATAGDRRIRVSRRRWGIRAAVEGGADDLHRSRAPTSAAIRFQQVTSLLGICWVRVPTGRRG